jgi:hypothetical protein
MEDKNIFNPKFSQNVQDKNGLLLYNDPTKSDIVYLLQPNHFYIMKANTYEIIRTIPNLGKTNLLSFKYNDNDYIMAYDKKSFILYPYTTCDDTIQYLFNFNDDVISIYNISYVNKLNLELLHYLSQQFLDILHDLCIPRAL